MKRVEGPSTSSLDTSGSPERQVCVYMMTDRVYSQRYAERELNCGLGQVQWYLARRVGKTDN